MRLLGLIDQTQLTKQIRMKFLNITVCTILLFLGTISTNLKAQDTGGGKTGVGIMLGEPSGISLKSWNNSTTAIDLGLAWSLSGKDAIHVHADYLWHKWLDVDKGELAFFYGLGGRAVFTDDPFAGVRIPFGLNYLVEDSPIGIFFELAPILDFLPDTNGDANGSLGVRFYF